MPIATRAAASNSWRDAAVRSVLPLLLTSALATLFACSREAPTRMGISSTRSFSPATASQNETELLTLPRGEAQSALCQLYAALDVDCDRRLTILDQREVCDTPPCTIALEMELGGQRVALGALHEASQLATELAEALSATSDPNTNVRVDLNRVFDNPVDYLGNRIETRYWTALTRTVTTSETDLREALLDEKQGGAAKQNVDWCASELPSCTSRASSTAPFADAPFPQQTHYLYVPEGDTSALRAYEPLERTMALRVEQVPSPVTSEWVTNLTRHNQHGLLMLAHDENGDGLPFVVPGGRFNEMYGWDSYFIAWGLLESGKFDLAMATTEHQAYEIIHYGKVLNANRSYYLTRTQPPFFPALVRMVLDHAKAPALEDNDGSGGEIRVEWRARMLEAAELEYSNVWAAAPRKTDVCDGDVCLARYFDTGVGQPPEVEFGHFAAFYQQHAKDHGHCPEPDATARGRHEFVECARDLERAYASGELADPEIDSFFVNDRCVRESGHDTTFRWFEGGKERCTSYATVDLNTLLLQYELDMAHLYRRGYREQEEKFGDWCSRARRRAALIQRYLWNEAAGAYFDYDVEQKRQSTYLAATTLYPLIIPPENACNVSLMSASQARLLVDQALPRLEAPGGLMASAREAVAKVVKPSLLRASGALMEEDTPARQWEAPNGWAPHQMLAWRGLQHHGFTKEAQRLAYRWLLLIAENAANFHGTVPEKFDVVARSHRVFAEYGNVNTEFSYIATEGFGWMNASFVVGQSVLTAEQRSSLRGLTPTESVF